MLQMCGDGHQTRTTFQQNTPTAVSGCMVVRGTVYCVVRPSETVSTVKHVATEIKLIPVAFQLVIRPQ